MPRDGSAVSRSTSRSHIRTRSVLRTPVRAFAVRLHATGCSLREITTILAELGVERSYQAVWQWVHRLSDSVPDPPEARAKRVAVDETAVKINGEWSWLDTAIDLDTKLISDVALFGHYGTDPVATFLFGLVEKHDLSNATFLVDQFGYRTLLARLGLDSRVDYTDRNLIEKWFHTLTMRLNRFHNSWVGSQWSVRQWLALFAHYYNWLRSHQSLDDRTPADKVLN